VKRIINIAIVLATIIAVSGCDLQQTANDAANAAKQVSDQAGQAIGQGTFKAKIVGLSVALSGVELALNGDNVGLSSNAINTWDNQGWSLVAAEVKAKSADSYSTIQADLDRLKSSIQAENIGDAKQAEQALRKALDDFAATQ
jgi:hypothetical protein